MHRKFHSLVEIPLQLPSKAMKECDVYCYWMWTYPCIHLGDFTGSCKKLMHCVVAYLSNNILPLVSRDLFAKLNANYQVKSLWQLPQSCYCFSCHLLKDKTNSEWRGTKSKKSIASARYFSGRQTSLVKVLSAHPQQQGVGKPSLNTFNQALSSLRRHFGQISKYMKN